MCKRAMAFLGRPLGASVLLTGYSMAAAAMLCALDRVSLSIPPMYFTSTLGLIIYPLLFTITGAAAGKQLLLHMPPVVLAVLIAASNIYGTGLFSAEYYGSSLSYYLQQMLPLMAAYLFLGYASLLLSRPIVWKRPSPHTRTAAVLGALALYILAYGVIYVPGFCWGHPFWCEMLWYLVHFGIAALLGVCSGLDIRKLFLIPLLPPIITDISGGPPAYPMETRIPADAARAWPMVCLLLGIGCMLVTFLVKRTLHNKG